MTETTTNDVVQFRDLTDFQKKSLTIIAGNDQPYGLEIKRELEDYYNKEVNHGRLYPNLDDLVDAGYVEKGEIDKRTNSYSITKKGIAVLKNELGWTAMKLTDSDIDFEAIDPEDFTDEEPETETVSASA